MTKKNISRIKELSVPIELIDRRIYIIRGQKVMLDSDLARLYHAETKALIQTVKRNLDRFPEDFMFQLSAEEAENMRSQIVTASRRNVRFQPYAFTEHGVSMLSSVLRSNRAVQMNILIVRAFVRMRELLATHKDLAERIERVEIKQKSHSSIISILADEIEKMKQLPEIPSMPKIGFGVDESIGAE